MRSTNGAWTRRSPSSADDPYRCAVCGQYRPVLSLARDCERRHNPPAPAVRGTAEVTDPDELGGFECRWYAHRGGRPVHFARQAEVELYMARMGLPRPDEFLVPVAA